MLNKKYFLNCAAITGSICLLFSVAQGQTVSTQVDTAIRLDEAIVRGYLSQQPLLQTPASVGLVSRNQLINYSGESALPAINTIPGVRMEERSPGSYRLSLRGSLLRSPFGVRNVKVYLDEFPLTDAGGNTYLNLIDSKSMQSLEVLKGPDGSLFGANSGGVVLVDVTGKQPADRLLSVDVNGGSYGLFHESVQFQKKWNGSQLNINQGVQRSDGYRENSAMKRYYLQVAQQWQYSTNSRLKLLALYSDMNYQTPGGLNEAQFLADPRQARPAAGPNPSAVSQQAQIDNKTFFGGISNETQIKNNLKHIISIFGTHTDFTNPFITNYEIRDENNIGLRSYFDFSGKVLSDAVSWKWNVGLEWQKSYHDIYNYDNNGGERGLLQTAAGINSDQHFYFTRVNFNVADRLTVESAVSLNYYKYIFESIPYDEAEKGRRNFPSQWMPRFALSYLVTPQLAWRASVSRGYSTPTTAEIRPSNTIINTNLNAETGWNYETGFRLETRNNRFQVDASVFNYQMKSAIVRRLDEGGDEFFTNAGGTKQTGVEALISAWLLPANNSKFIRGLVVRSSYTYSLFEFKNYSDATQDYSGNRLTGVPRNSMVSNFTILFPKGFSFFSQYNYTSKIPLNDANSVFAADYHLLEANLSWQGIVGKKTGMRIFLGGDNLLNETYSLGNDLNAFGKRYYNAASLRNFNVGLTVSL
jgi:iron complex outermembrane receptor protein